MSAIPGTLAEFGLRMKSRKVKHRKLTAEAWAVLEKEADLLAQLHPQKELAEQLGMSRSYVAQVLSRLVQERLGRVPRVAHICSLDGEVE